MWEAGDVVRPASQIAKRGPSPNVLWRVNLSALRLVAEHNGAHLFGTHDHEDRIRLNRRGATTSKPRE